MANLNKAMKKNPAASHYVDLDLPMGNLKKSPKLGLLTPSPMFLNGDGKEVKKRPVAISPLNADTLLATPLLGNPLAPYPNSSNGSSPMGNSNNAWSPLSSSGLGGGAKAAAEPKPEGDNEVIDETPSELGSLRFRRNLSFSTDRKIASHGVPMTNPVPKPAHTWHNEDREFTRTDVKPTQGTVMQWVCMLFFDIVLPIPIATLVIILCGILAVSIRETKSINTQPSVVEVRDKGLYVDDKLYIVKGVAYHPVWKGVDARYEYPFGDIMHMTSVRDSLFRTSYREYNRFHLRKIAKIFNTIRLYNWLLDRDHTDFLDDCHALGLKVIVTFWMDSKLYSNLEDTQVLKSMKVNFAHLLRKYRSHPAVLMWAISNEPNLEDNPNAFYGVLPAFFQAVKVLSDVRDSEENRANGYSPHPMMVPMANSDEVRDQMEKFDGSSGFEVWGLQPYVGADRLNDMLLQFNLAKPILISEYGADSLQDFSIGESAFKQSGQSNILSEANQTSSLMSLSRVISKYLGEKANVSICYTPVCPSDTITQDALPDPRFVKINNYRIYNKGTRDPLTHLVSVSFVEEGDDAQTLDDVAYAWENGSLLEAPYQKLIGGAVFEWMDEWWKGSKFDPDHPNCNVDEADVQSTCGAQVRGYGLDQRLNEEWLGVSAQNVTDEMLCLRLKPALSSLSSAFAVANESFQDCGATDDCCTELPHDYLLKDYTMAVHLLVLAAVLLMLFMSMCIVRFLVIKNAKKSQGAASHVAEVTAPNWIARAGPSGPSMHGERQHRGDCNVLHAGSTPKGDIDAFVPFERIRDFLLGHTDVQHALNDLSWALANPVVWNGTQWVLRDSVKTASEKRAARPWLGAAEPASSKLPLNDGDSVLVPCEYKGQKHWVTGTLKSRCGDIALIKLASKLVIEPFGFRSEYEDHHEGKEVSVLVNNRKQNAEVEKVGSALKAVVENLKVSVSDIKAAAELSFPDKDGVIKRSVKLTPSIAKAVLENSETKPPSKEDIAKRPRYNVNLAYEAYVHAVGQAVLRRCFTHHKEKDKDKMHSEEQRDYLTLEGNDFVAGDLPREIIIDAVKTVHDDILPPECLGFSPKASAADDMKEFGSRVWKGEFGLVMRPVLFLIIQQRVDNLRQSKWLKVMLYDWILRSTEDRDPTMVLDCVRDVVNMCQHHLELVKSDTVNYADVDEIYHQMYKAKYGGVTQWHPINDTRSMGRTYTMYSMSGIVKNGDALQKTFPERLSWVVPVRLFTFTVHAHLTLFYGMLAVQMNFKWGLTWWLLASVESIICIMNRLIDLWMFPLPKHHIRFSLLSLVELGCSLFFGIVKFYPDTKGNDFLQADVVTGYIAFMWVSQLIIRPLGNLQFRISLKHPTRFLSWRACTLFAMLLMQASVAWFIIVPSVATLTLSVCRCTEVDLPVLSNFITSESHCTADGKDVVCFVSLVLIFITTFISLTLLAHVSYMLLSIVCGYIVGFKKKLGTVKQWSDVQALMEAMVKKSSKPSPLEHDSNSAQVVPDLSIYGSFMPQIQQTGVFVRIEKCVNVKGSARVEVHPQEQEENQICTHTASGSNPQFYRDVYFGEANIKYLVFKVIDERQTRETVVAVGTTRMHHRIALTDDAFLEVTVSKVVNGVKHVGNLPKHLFVYHQLCMYRGIFVHLWERDLINKSQCDAYCRWSFESAPPEEALIHFLQFFNGGAGLKAMFPTQNMAQDQAYILTLLQKKVSVFAMKSLTFFVPYYAETVLYTMKDLVQNEILQHMVDIWREEWEAFVERNFFGLKDAEKVLASAKQGQLHTLWGKLRKEYEDGCIAGSKKWGEYTWRYDGPPLSQLEDIRASNTASTHATYEKRVQYWIERQVRLWASMRGQTLARNVYGLCDMREAVVDLAYYEMKSAQGCRWVTDELRPTERSTVTEVLGWVATNSLLSKEWGESVKASFTTINGVSYKRYVCHALLYYNIDGARLFGSDSGWKHCSTGWEKLLSAVELRKDFCKNIDDAQGSEAKNVTEGKMLNTLASQIESAIAISAEANALREKAEVLVSTKIQLCFGAQVYFAKDEVRNPTNELLRMDRFRHLELATDFTAGTSFRSVHIARKAAPVNRTNFLNSYGEPAEIAKRGTCEKCKKPLSVVRCGNGDPHPMEQFSLTVFDRQAPLKLGEGKAENQNNMITCARGEVLNILDMNQDGYYSEGIKLPFITNLWNDFNRSNIEEGYKSQHKDTYQVMGFREHIFTQSHSAVGRYMALAEFSFVTLIQRFLASPHEVRMHYGHPDMVNAHLMKQTGGVSRASLSVNVNEDIFLGYEMAQNGRRICMIENLSFGKGREVDFNNASVFLKKLSAGCVMQLSSRDVHNLYTKILSLNAKWALFYGSIAHFMNIFLMDLTIFAFTYALMFFSLADITPQVLRLNQSPLSDPWLFQIGMFYIVPMLVEMNLERSYLKLSDFIMSVPFFSHQNRITASFFGMTMHTGTAKYLGTGRGMGNQPNSFIEFFIHHTWTNFIPGFKLIACIVVFWWGSNGCNQCENNSGFVRLWIVIVSAVSYLAGPALYNPKPSFTLTWGEAKAALEWMHQPVPVKFCKSSISIDTAAFAAHATHGGGSKKSLLVFWIFEWFEYLNSKALSASGSVVSSLSVLFKEFVFIIVKYLPWAAVVYFTLVVPRGTGPVEITHDPVTGNVSTSIDDIPMHTLRPDILLLLVLDIFLWEVVNASIYIFPNEGYLSGIIRLIRLAAVPFLILVAIITIFVYGKTGVWEAIRDLIGYMFLLGTAFSLLTDTYIAMVQFVISVQGGVGKIHHLQTSLYNGDTDERIKVHTCTECRMAGVRLHEKNCPHCKAAMSPLGFGSRSGKVPCTITEAFVIVDKANDSETVYSVDCDGEAAVKKRRLWHLNFVARWSPLLMYFRRMYYLVIAVLSVTSLLASALSAVHTTWLFNDRVAKRRKS